MEGIGCPSIFLSTDQIVSKWIDINIAYVRYVGMLWSVEVLNKTVEKELLTLHDNMRPRIERIVSLITEFGLEKIGMPCLRNLRGKLWEMRVTGKEGIARAIYVVVTGKRVVIGRAFVRKTQKTPKREIDLALKRAMEIE